MPRILIDEAEFSVVDGERYSVQGKLFPCCDNSVPIETILPGSPLVGFRRLVEGKTMRSSYGRFLIASSTNC